MRVMTAVAGLACLLALGCEGENSKGQPQAPAIQPAATVPVQLPSAKPEDPGSRRTDEAMDHKAARTPPAAKVLTQGEVDAMMKRFEGRAALVTPEQLQARQTAQGLQ
jgi:hypothetical protein